MSSLVKYFLPIFVICFLFQNKLILLYLQFMLPLTFYAIEYSHTNSFTDLLKIARLSVDCMLPLAFQTVLQQKIACTRFWILTTKETIVV